MNIRAELSRLAREYHASNDAALRKAAAEMIMALRRGLENGLSPDMAMADVDIIEVAA